jgi:hypothetical protein
MQCWNIWVSSNQLETRGLSHAFLRWTDDLPTAFASDGLCLRRPLPPTAFASGGGVRRLHRYIGSKTQRVLRGARAKGAESESTARPHASDKLHWIVAP